METESAYLLRHVRPSVCPLVCVSAAAIGRISVKCYQCGFL
jgi:hypothetical protein